MLLLILGVFLKEFYGFSEALAGPAQGGKATDQSKILDLGSQNSVLQHDMCPIFFSKNHTTLMYRIVSAWPCVYSDIGLASAAHFRPLGGCHGAGGLTVVP